MKLNGGVDLRILGIDPGYAIVGFGVLEYNSGKFTVVDYGAITTSSQNFCIPSAIFRGA